LRNTGDEETKDLTAKVGSDSNDWLGGRITVERAYENIDNLEQQSDPMDQEIDYLRDALAFKITEVQEAEGWILKVEADRDRYRKALEIIRDICNNGVMADETMRRNVILRVGEALA
jgi:hypothetical protein